MATEKAKPVGHQAKNKLCEATATVLSDQLPGMKDKAHRRETHFLDFSRAFDTVPTVNDSKPA